MISRLVPRRSGPSEERLPFWKEHISNRVVRVRECLTRVDCDCEPPMTDRVLRSLRV